MPLEHLDLSILPSSFRSQSILSLLGVMTAYSAPVAFAPSSCRLVAVRLAPAGHWVASRIGEYSLDLWARDLEIACTCSYSSVSASMGLAPGLLALPLALSAQALVHFHLLFLSSKSF